MFCIRSIIDECKFYKSRTLITVYILHLLRIQPSFKQRRPSVRDYTPDKNCRRLHARESKTMNDVSCGYLTYIYIHIHTIYTLTYLCIWLKHIMFCRIDPITNVSLVTNRKWPDRRTPHTVFLPEGSNQKVLGKISLQQYYSNLLLTTNPDDENTKRIILLGFDGVSGIFFVCGRGGYKLTG